MHGTTDPTGPARFAILGPVQLRVGGREVATGSPQQQALLVALLLRRGHTAGIDELIGMLWGDRPPAAALGTVRTYVSRARALLKGTAVEITSSAGGYRMHGDGLQCDAWELEEAVATASQRAAHELEPLVERRLTAVLGTRAGTPLEGLPGEWAEAQRVRLNGLRVTGTEILLQARLHGAGPTAAEFDALTALLQAQPLHEGLRALAVLALHRQGRRAEALDLFRAGATLLRDELGLSPGPALREAQAQVLREEPGNIAPRPAAHLPTALADFVGRERELTTLRAALTDRSGSRVAGITGMGGSGRTSLAVTAAHQLAGHFPDGQLYCDVTEAGGLDGVLEQLLRLLGGQVPAGTHARVSALSRLVTGRRVLVVVDNAGSADQIQVLRRALPRTALLFTSLRPFHGMNDVTWARLQPLSLPESLALFAAVAGPERVAQSPGGSRELAALSGGYALAVRVFAQRVRDFEHWSVAAISENMRAEMADAYPSDHEDCSLLAAPVQRTHDALAPEAARAARVLGVLPEEEISAGQVAAVLGVPEHRAFFALSAGTDVSLLREGDSDHRYRLSDPVVRTVMMRLAHAIDGPEEVARVQAVHAAISDRQQVTC
ncbi:AfsR/SARP family transcriptional regulator [Kineosporia succinea]|uniref:DNA-binding SARP family transcriptional activator n=1 Tax=Kineosporia succinea TaxID=84632 RepID=A0ABT9PAA6_9ACTN|nr:BTAD domain-containing putative transcriptional regulator [Kineosporia succinea]MDP9829608.1 DNA-binding SARP family transcriptional activator [Kineosporia succinea]